MNKHLERIKAEDEAFRAQRKKRNRTSLISIVLCVVVFFTVYKLDPFGAWGNNSEPTAADMEENWQLQLVSQKHALPKDYKVTLAKNGDVLTDSRMEKDFLAMQKAAKDTSIPLNITSSYRRVSEQDDFYRRRGNENALCCYQDPAGKSEHHTGLALDVSTGDDMSSEEFAATATYSWLIEHGPQYGFVLRYPEGKKKATGMDYESRHFRYVGIDAAKEMTASGLCLEEYLKEQAKTA